jgi:hypothetical protein
MHNLVIQQNRSEQKLLSAASRPLACCGTLQQISNSKLETNGAFDFWFYVHASRKMDLPIAGDHFLENSPFPLQY